MSWLFEKINDPPLARLTKMKTEMTQINKIRNNSREITTDVTEMQKLMTTLNSYMPRM